MPTNSATSPTPPRERLSMDPGWKFHLGDIPVPEPKTHEIAYGWNWAKAGAFRGGAHVELNDSDWRSVDLPHDWASFVQS